MSHKNKWLLTHLPRSGVIGRRQWAPAASGLVLLGAMLGGCSSPKDPPRPAVRQAQSPLASATSIRRQVHGEAVEVLQVPHYTYVRVAFPPASPDEGGASESPIWVATLKKDVRVGAAVDVTLVASRSEFSSSALKRTFEKMFFGVVVKSS